MNSVIDLPASVVGPGNRPGLLARLHLDLQLLGGLLLIAGLGLVVLYSAGDQSADQVQRQLVRLGVAFVAMLLLAQVPTYHLQRWAPWLFGIGILLLVAVLVVGHVGKGAQRWLDLGLFRFQPSEMMKLAVPLMVAWYLAENPLPPTLGRLVMAGTLIVVPVLLIAKQPDLGTALLIACAGGFTLILAGMS